MLLQENYSAADATAVQELLPDRLASYCRNRNAEHTPHIVFRETKYNFLSLRSWRDSISSEFLDMTGAASIGISNRSNRLVMRVLPQYVSAITGAVHSRADFHGIPNDGYEIIAATPPSPKNCPSSANGPEIHDPTAPYTTDCFRPVTAGIASQISNTGGSINYGGCTIGSANDRYMPSLGTWLPGYTINSHCTPTQFSMQSDWLWQSTEANGDVVAMEAVDPSGWSCGALGVFTCRYSDSAWMQAYAPGGSAQHGTIARTLYSASPVGSKTLDSSADRFLIDGKGTIVEDEQVDKVGAATGWTTGAITDDCSDENVYDSNNNLTGFRLLCQVSATYDIEPGDSGSPVFFWRYWEGSTVELLGITWGGCALPEECDSSFSPQDSVESELGTLYISYPYF